MKYLLLFAPCVVALVTPLYNSLTPELGGLPFFYWFQLLLIVISAIGIYFADRVGRTRP